MVLALSLSTATISCNKSENATSASQGKATAAVAADSTAQSKVVTADSINADADAGITPTATTAEPVAKVEPLTDNSTSTGIVGLDFDFVKRAINETGFLTRANSHRAIEQFRILANISGTPEVWTSLSDEKRQVVGNFIVILSTVGISGYPVDAGPDFPFSPEQVAEIKTIAEAGMQRSQSAY